MPSRPTSALRLVLAMLVMCAFCIVPAKAWAEDVKQAKVVRNDKPAPVGHEWCGQGFEALPSDVCYIDGRTKAPRRTLVIWLHGVIGKDTNWSWNHEKMLARIAKYSGIEVLFPKGIPDNTVYAWPGTADSQAKNEGALIDQWMAAKALLEKRENTRFDEVFVFGFSSGAYFASSLAMRGRVDVDGYAVFAGGQPMVAPSAPVTHWSPTFVGVCANDASTSNHSRAFAGSLASAGIARMIDTQKVGHDLSEVHFVHALGFLRAKMTKHERTGA